MLAECYPRVNTNAVDENDDITDDAVGEIITKSTLNPRKNRRCSNFPSCVRLAKEHKGWIPSI